MSPASKGEEWEQYLKDKMEDQCEELGYYEVSRGYRKIPQNTCVNGVEKAPIRTQCSRGFVGTLFSIKGIFICAILGAVTYYGWPLIEAILIMLPLPDPAQMKLQIMHWYEKLRSFVTRDPHLKKDSTAAGYQKDFELAPEVLNNGEDTEDDDEDDVGRL